jgi:hypothetical protein
MILMIIILAMIGFMLVLLGSSGILGLYGVVPGFMGGLMMLMSVISMIGVIIKERLTPYFEPLRKDEEITWHITRRGRVFPLKVTSRKEGLLYWKKRFFADAKGAELTSPSGKPISISLQRYGFTLEPKMSGYFSKLKFSRKLKDEDEYDEALELYLGPIGYATFKTKFREKKPLPDKFDIEDELKWLLDFQQPADSLEYNVAGETINFRDALGFMKYSYDTAATENSIEREKLDIMLRNASYSPEAMKFIGIAIAVFIIIIGVVVALFALQSVDFGSFFGG